MILIESEMKGGGKPEPGAKIQICAARCWKVLNSRRPSLAGPSPGNSRRGNSGFQVLSSDKPGDGPVGMPLIKNFPLMRALHICILPPSPCSGTSDPWKRNTPQRHSDGDSAGDAARQRAGGNCGVLRRPVCEHGLIEQEGASATAHRKTDRALSRSSLRRDPGI